jgi:hypothetical protein
LGRATASFSKGFVIYEAEVVAEPEQGIHVPKTRKSVWGFGRVGFSKEVDSGKVVLRLWFSVRRRYCLRSFCFVRRRLCLRRSVPESRIRQRYIQSKKTFPPIPPIQLQTTCIKPFCIIFKFIQTKIIQTPCIN